MAKKKVKSIEEVGLVFEPEIDDTPRRPNSVRVFGRDYSINYIPEFMGLQDCGTTDNHNLLINVKEHQLPIEEADTVLHETFHAIEYVMDLNLEEHQIRALATGLLGVLQDNPVFARYIIKERNRKTVE